MDIIPPPSEHADAPLQVCERLNRSKDPIYDSLACLLRGKVSTIADKVILSPSTLNISIRPSVARFIDAADVFGRRNYAGQETRNLSRFKPSINQIERQGY